MAKISEIMLLQQAAQPALTIEVQTDINGLPKAIGESFMKIASYLETQGVVTTDIPFVIYKDLETMTEHNVKMVAGFKLSKALPDRGEIKCIELPGQKIASCIHLGSYSELADLYKEMSEWIKSKGYVAEGSSVEYYYSGPEVPENAQVTRIEMPLK
jgi:effector-binding domain-containing protein